MKIKGVEREQKRLKKKNGMQVRGRSVLLLDYLSKIQKRKKVRK
jgi:hypothetical protein